MKDRSRAAVGELSNTRKSFASLMSRTGIVKPDLDAICVFLSQQAASVRVEVALRVSVGYLYLCAFLIRFRKRRGGCLSKKIKWVEGFSGLEPSCYAYF